jgi:hypothetical protein
VAVLFPKFQNIYTCSSQLEHTNANFLVVICVNVYHSFLTVTAVSIVEAQVEADILVQLLFKQGTGADPPSEL